MQSPLIESPSAVVVGAFGPPSGAARGLAVLTTAGGWAAPPLKADSPAFVVRHPRLPRLYAIAADHDRVVEIETDPHGAPQRIVSRAPTGGRPAHVAVSPDGRTLVVCCYGDGTVDAFALDADGRIAERRDAPAPPGGSRAHHALFLGRGEFLTTDLGLDLVLRWRLGRDGVAVVGVAEAPRGSGPRHLAAGPEGGIHVITEYSVEVLALRGDHVVSSSPVLARGRRAGDTGAHLSIAGTRAYATVRGSNRVAVLAADGERLAPIGDVDSGGERPRHHALVHGGLLVANEATDEVVAFALDGDGMPVLTDRRWATPSPTCLLPLT